MVKNTTKGVLVAQTGTLKRCYEPTMRGFHVTICQDGQVLRFSAIGKSASSVMDYCFGMLNIAAPFSICIRSHQ